MTTTPITDQPTLRTEPFKGDDARRLIIIPLVQNLIAGVAVGLLGCIVLFPLALLRVDTMAAAFAGGLAVACAVTIFRFFADDIGLLGWAHKQGRASRQPEIDALNVAHKEELDKANGELRAEQGRHRDTKRERDEFELSLRVMRGNGKYVHGESTEDPIVKDAHALINEWARRSYEPPTQRLMAEAGWTPQRYTKALVYLGSKGVIDRNSTKPKWLVDTKAEAAALLGID